jgi:hypothetical protein
MMNPWKRGDADFDPITIARFPWTLVGGAILAFWALWWAPSARLKHIADVARAISPALTFLTVLLAVLGWFVTARLNADLVRRTERDKQEHARAGTRRQVKTLLRAVLPVISAFFLLV